ncbi:MAG: hypothetical protein GF416_01650 [Candidatus Altiarchaeales archaeon]|nr:hypothetical protein [Candidatus Altiarchaeales archaeon]MBD3415820.1 hypothetical protein [Candidatus Altiarchaeales archaeon]
MIGVVGQVQRKVESIKDRILKDIIRLQKKELDSKIDDMLKPPKVNRITIKFIGRGLGVGKRMRGFVGKGLSLVRKLI